MTDLGFLSYMTWWQRTQRSFVRFSVTKEERFVINIVTIKKLVMVRKQDGDKR